MANTTTTTKMTQRDYFNEIIALATANDRMDIVDFCNSRIEQINKKNANSSSKPKKATEEQIELRSKIVEYLKTVESATVADMVVALGVSSNQKITGNVTKLVGDKVLEKVPKTKAKEPQSYKLA